MALDPLTAGIDLAGSIINKIWPDKSDQEKAQLAAAVAVVQGQIDINKAEAANPSVFVAGWRPFIGWVCGTACAWNWIGLPAAKFACSYFGHPVELSAADLAEMWPLLMGMLGLGGFRTYEKVKGVSR
jgi:hypothetical protein